MPEPWDVPRTEEGRDELAKLISKYRDSGEIRELGICLSRMGAVVKHVGTGDDKGAFDTSAEFGDEAVKLLRQTDDKKELIRALRVSATPLVMGIDHKAVLLEALSLAREIGDVEEEGWTIFRMTRANGVDGYTIEQALECFRSCGCIEGEAYCLVSLGFRRRPREPELLKKGAALFDKTGNTREAERARLMLSVCTDDDEEP